MKLTYKELAKKVLEEENKPLSVEEIWEIAKKKGYDKYLNSIGKTPWRTLGAQLYVDIKDNPTSPFIKIDSTRPKKFFLKNLISKEKELKKFQKEVAEDTFSIKTKSSYSERDLHHFLAYYAYTYMNILVKTIYHEKSSKKKYSQWLHPDLVGVEFPIEEWTNEVIDFAKEIGSIPIILYSFEVKKRIGFDNLRESFFQSVSNSSWANEGYLVTAEISNDEELFIELRRLSSSFGIGIIKLDIENPDNSEVMFPAKRKAELDWNTINKLAVENPDFREFLKQVKNSLSIKEIWKDKYDKVYKSEELIKKIKNKLS